MNRAQKKIREKRLTIMRDITAEKKAAIRKAKLEEELRIENERLRRVAIQARWDNRKLIRIAAAKNKPKTSVGEW